MLAITASLVEEDALLANGRRFVEGISSQTMRDGYASSLEESEESISETALLIEAGGPLFGRRQPDLFHAVDDVRVGRAPVPVKPKTGGQRYRTPMVCGKQSPGKDRRLTFQPAPASRSSRLFIYHVGAF